MCGTADSLMLSQLCDTPESLILTQYMWDSRQFNADTICQYRTDNLMTTKFFAVQQTV